MHALILVPLQESYFGLCRLVQNQNNEKENLYDATIHYRENSQSLQTCADSVW